MKSDKKGEIKSWIEQTETLNDFKTNRKVKWPEKGNYENEKAAKEKKDIWRYQRKKKEI